MALSLPPETPHSRSVIGAGTPGAPTPRVLLVEDDAAGRLTTLSMLRHLGVEAEAAADGQEGVRLAAARRYDIVLMDIQMPVMGGVEAMKSIRSLLPPERCPRIVAVTAHAVSGTHERMLAAGFDAFCDKPLTISALTEAVALPLAEPPAGTPAFVVRPMTDARHTAEARAARDLIDQVHAHVRGLLGEDDPEFVADLIETFAASSREAAAEAHAAQQSQDTGAVAAAAHKLRGSASNVGLDDLTDLWTGIEEAARRGDPTALGPDLDRALAETAHATDLLAG